MSKTKAERAIQAINLQISQLESKKEELTKYIRSQNIINEILDDFEGEAISDRRPRGANGKTVKDMVVEIYNKYPQGKFTARQVQELLKREFNDDIKDITVRTTLSHLQVDGELVKEGYSDGAIFYVTK